MAENISQLSHNAHIISLENSGLSSLGNGKIPRINSPRSLEALNRLGYEVDELQYLDLKQFKLKHPEVLNLPENIIKSRYDYYEKRRALKLDEALKVSINIIKERENVGNDEYFVSKMNKSQMGNFGQNKTSGSIEGGKISVMASTSTAINNEIKAFERIKKKQEMEIVNMIQGELMAELQRKENEEKIKSQLDKQMMLQRIKDERKKAEAEKQIQMIKEKERKEKEAEVERKQNDLKKYIKEQKFLKEELEKQRQRAINLKLKQERDAQQQELLRRKTEAIFKDQQKKLEERQKMMEDRDEERKENLELKRLQQLQLNKEKQERQQRIIAQTMKNLEDKLRKQELDYHLKQEKKEEKLKQYENLRQIAFKNNKEKAMHKAQEIQQVINKNIEREKEKVELYYKKQEEIAKRKAELDEKNQVENNKKVEYNKQQEQKIHDVLKHNEQLLEERKNSIIFKIQKTEAVVGFKINL